MDWSELIAETAIRLGATGFPARAAQLTQQAEARLSEEFKPFEYPPLTPLAAGRTNWLLRDNQEIYIAALISQHYLSQGAAEEAIAAEAHMMTLIGAKKKAERTVSHYRVKFRTAGPTP